MTTAARSRSYRALLAAGVAGALALTSLGTVEASSHREAPLIAEDPVADNTDTYAFVSPTDADNTVLVANYIPLQAPNGGPNFYNFGEDVLYAINVDNDGDAVADTTFEFDFTTEFTDPNSFLYAFGPITSLTGDGAAAWNLRQYYTLSVVKDGVRTVLGQDLIVPPNNLGPRTTPNYAGLSDAAITTVDADGNDILVFAGQKDDPIWVDLGSVFDLGTLRPFEGLHLIPQPDTDPIDAVYGKNVHSLVLEVPSSYLTAAADQPVVGVWATASRRQVRTFAGGSSASPMYTGPFRQVSRLGMPLVNEVVIPIGLKDAFNTLSPDQDAAVLAGVELNRASGANSTEGPVPVVTDPELLDLFPVLYPGAFDTDGDGPDEGAFPLPQAPRMDVFAAFLTGFGSTTGGLDGLCLTPGEGDCAPFNAFAGGVPSEMIRLNTAVAPADGDLNNDNRLGVLGGDAQGFPNGRRLADDATDIELQLLAGAAINPDNFAPLSDGVLTNDLPFVNSFPYLAQAHSGYYAPEPADVENNL